MTEVEIQIAREIDTDNWARLRCMLWPDCKAERHALEVEQLLGSDGMVALAKVEGKVVGFAEVSVRRDHVEGTSATPVAYLEGWFVEEQYRGRGVGRALVRFVEAWACGKGFSEMASDAELWNEQSIRLHGLLGFREVGRTVHFVKELKKEEYHEGQESVKREEGEIRITIKSRIRELPGGGRF